MWIKVMTSGLELREIEKNKLSKYGEHGTECSVKETKCLTTFGMIDHNHNNNGPHTPVAINFN